MGKVSGNWITGAHSGRACSKEQIYTKVNKKTGACYSVKLCNPNSDWTESQLTSRKAFSAISSAISAWISTNKVSTGANNADYKKVLQKFNAQSKYSTLRGFMIAKGMYTVDSEGLVTVDITANTDFKGVSASISGASDENDDENGGDETPSAAKYTVSLAASPSGAGSVSGAGEYAAGESANISASANSGYAFVRWNDGDTNASRTVTVNSDLDLTAVFTSTNPDDSSIVG